MSIRRILTFLVCVLTIPRNIKSWLLRLLGHSVDPTAVISPSALWVERIFLGAGARIGWGNFVSCRRLLVREKGYLGIQNVLRGPFSVWIKKEGAIGNRNLITRAKHPVSIGPSILRIGVLSKITAGHFIDLTRSVRIGDYSILAGKSSQLWTHGYYHAPSGRDRVRVDGEISIGDNVYVGSSVVITAGVSIGRAVVVGANACVSKTISEPGLYVNQPLRLLPFSYETAVEGLGRPDATTPEVIFSKRK